MTNSNVSLLTTALIVIAAVMVILLIILAVIYIRMRAKEKNADNLKKAGDDEDKKGVPKTKQYTIDSVFNFMEFDKIEDNMIIQKNGKRYVMVIECQGINYDLMSQEEKIGVEEGFSQFLNTLKEPIQLYIQTRKINLESSLNNYKEKVDEIEREYSKQKMRYEQLAKNPNISEDLIQKEYYEYIKQKNLYEYGKDIIYNTERMSLNKNILNEKYYAVLSYYSESGDEAYLDKDEIRERAFSELYTKSKSVIRALSVSGVIGKILNSTELADLLYVAYNRDESEDYGIDKARRARFDELYLTAQDYVDKKMQLLDEEIEAKAYQKANEVVVEVQSEKAKRYTEKKRSIDDIVSSLAEMYIEENAGMLGDEIAEEAKEKIQEERENRRKETKEDVQ